MMNIFDDSLAEHQALFATLGAMRGEIERFAAAAIEALRAGKKILIMGNGGSAADSQHFAAELVSRFKKERTGLPAIALTTDTSIITAIGNDYHYNRVFARQVEALGSPGDLVLGISTSGNSANIVEAMHSARAAGCRTVGLLGRDGGAIAPLVDLPVIVRHQNTPRVQEGHLLIIHVVCEIIEETLFQ